MSLVTIIIIFFNMYQNNEIFQLFMNQNYHNSFTSANHIVYFISHRLTGPSNNNSPTQTAVPTGIVKKTSHHRMAQFHRIDKILWKQNIMIASRPQQSFGSQLTAPKDRIAPKKQGVYKVPCGDYNHSHIVESNYHIRQWAQEHGFALNKDLKISISKQPRLDTNYWLSIRKAIEEEKRQYMLDKCDDTL